MKILEYDAGLMQPQNRRSYQPNYLIHRGIKTVLIGTLGG
jgi:hypothetical protein